MGEAFDPELPIDELGVPCAWIASGREGGGWTTNGFACGWGSGALRGSVGAIRNGARLTAGVCATGGWGDKEGSTAQDVGGAAAAALRGGSGGAALDGAVGAALPEVRLGAAGGAALPDDAALRLGAAGGAALPDDAALRLGAAGGAALPDDAALRLGAAGGAALPDEVLRLGAAGDAFLARVASGALLAVGGE